MGLFTIEFEIGPETRGMIERIATETLATIDRIATTTAVQFELGPKTRETIGTLGMASKQGGKAREAIAGLLGKGDEATQEE